MTDAPTIITREQARLKPPTRPPVRVATHPGIVIHCTGGSRLKEPVGRWRIVQTSHQRERGWADIGYHFGVTPDGTILEGRGWNVRGAHAKGHNRWCGVVVFGRGTDITPAEKSTIEWLYAEHVRRGGGLTVLPHNLFSPKACPGPVVTRWVEERWPLSQPPA